MSLKSDTKFINSERPYDPAPKEIERIFTPTLGTPEIVEDLGSTDTVEEHTDTRKSVAIVAQLQAETFLNEVKAGKTLKDAAEVVGVPVRKLMGSPAVQKDLEDLLIGYTWDASVRREVSRAMANKILVDGNYKERIDAMKVINADPEVGIATGQQIAVQTNITLSKEAEKAAEFALTIPIEGLD